jgi:hypothetical protein
MRRINFPIVVALIVCALATSVVHANPLFNMWIVGRLLGSNASFSGNIKVQPGQTVEYQVWGQMATRGTSNTQVTKTSTGTRTVTRTIKNLVPYGGTRAIGDGMTCLAFDIWQDPGDPVQSVLARPTLNTDPTRSPGDSWDSGIGAAGFKKVRAGLSGEFYDLIDVRPVHIPGVFTAIAPEIILSGTFSVPIAAPGPASMLKLRWYEKGTGAIRINDTGDGKLRDGLPVPITPITEFGPDPIVGFIAPPNISAATVGLRLTSIPAAVPEPGTIGTIMAGLLLLGRLRTARNRRCANWAAKS